MLFNTVSSWVVIDSKYTEEYNVEHSEIDGVPHVTCWIGSQVGKNFEIHYRDTSGKIFAATVFVDGNKCGSRLVRRLTGHMDGITTSSTTLRPFMFSSLHFTEEEEDLAALGSLSNIGQIEVKIGYAVIVKENQTPTPVQVPIEQKVNEKAKKGIDHQTSFGEARVQRNLGAVHTKQIGKDVVRFCFRYRPLDVLRAHGIVPLDSARDTSIPTTTSASSSQPSRKRRVSTEPKDIKPQTTDNDVLELSDSEDERAAQNRRKKMKIKREQVKREPLGIQMSGEIIDLT